MLRFCRSVERALASLMGQPYISSNYNTYTRICNFSFFFLHFETILCYYLWSIMVYHRWRTGDYVCISVCVCKIWQKIITPSNIYKHISIKYLDVWKVVSSGLFSDFARAHYTIITHTSTCPKLHVYATVRFLKISIHFENWCNKIYPYIHPCHFIQHSMRIYVLCAYWRCSIRVWECEDYFCMCVWHICSHRAHIGRNIILIDLLCFYCFPIHSFYSLSMGL